MTEAVWTADELQLTTPLRWMLPTSSPILPGVQIVVLAGAALYMVRLEYLTVKWAFLDPEPSIEPAFPFIVGFVLLIILLGLVFVVQVLTRGQLLVTADATALRIRRRIGRWVFMQRSLPWEKLGQPSIATDGAAHRVAVADSLGRPIVLAIGLDGDRAQSVVAACRRWMEHA